MKQSVADSYISPSGRTPAYDRAAFTNDLLTASLFLTWAEDGGGYYGGVSANDAFRAVCRMLDVDPIALRKIATGG